MLLDKVAHEVAVLVLDHGIEIHGRHIAALISKIAALVVHIGDATCHAGSEVASTLAEHRDSTARHVLATVIADAFHDCGRTGVAYSETFAGHAVEEGLASGGAVKSDIADDDVVFGNER